MKLIHESLYVSRGKEYLSLVMYLSCPEEAKCLACFYLPPVGDAFEESTERIAPFLTIVGVDTTFISVMRNRFY